MIIIDINSLIIKDIVQMDKINESLIRHVSLNSLKSIIKKFRADYSLNLGVVLADDDSHSWRKDFFKYYKQNRKRQRDLSKFNWSDIYAWLNIVKEEIHTYFPVKYMKVPNCEADDIIAVLSSFVVERLQEDCLIISSDQDFVQLHSSNIFQYSPFQKDFVKFKVSPSYDLYVKIFRGDRSDGIPNYISDDDVFVNPHKRSNKISTIRVQELLSYCGNYEEMFNKLNEREKYGFTRNKTLIDFSSIPKEIQSSIINTFRGVLHSEQKTLNDLVNYLKEHRLNYLLTKVGDFEA